MTNITKSVSKEDKKMLNELFVQSFFCAHSYNYERQQGLGYSLTMWPVIRRFYKTKEEQGVALERHMAVFNATYQVETLIMGISAAMEKEASQNKNFDISSINSVKVSLMGPLSGIGDSIFWGSLRIIATGIGLSLAATGSVMGAIVFLLVFNIPHFIIKYYCTFLGYTVGTSLMTNAKTTGMLNKITKAMTIIGLSVVGAMTASMVKLSLTGEFMVAENVYTLQQYIDQMFPLLLPFAYTLFMLGLLNKGKKPTTILLITLIVGFGLVLTGLV